MQREPSGKIPVHWLVHLFKGFIEMGCPVTVYSLILLENEKIDIAKRRERRFSQLEDSIQSFQQIYDETHKEGSHVEESKTELSGKTTVLWLDNYSMGLENEKIDTAKRHERRFSQLEDSIQSFLERYRVLSEHSVAEESLENEVESQQSDMEQCKETEEEPSNHPIQKLYSDESLLSE